MYSILLTYMGASVAHLCKLIACAVGSMHEAENVASVKASEIIIYARTVLKALGVPPQGPTLLLTDNLSNKNVITNANAAQASRHYLQRQTCLHARVAGGDIRVAYVPDGENPADALSKSVGAEKARASAAYASGRAHRL